MAAGLVAGPKTQVSTYGQPVIPNLNVKHLCPNCRSDPPNIIEEYSKGDLVCADCGTILGDRIVDTRSEWRTFANDEGGDDPSRVGEAGNHLTGNQLETTISGRDGHSGMSRDLARAQAAGNNHRNGGKSSEAAQREAFKRIQDRCDLLQLGLNVSQRAQHVYKIVDDKRVVRNKRDQVVIAACISFATRGESGASRSLAEICKALNVSKKELGNVLNIIKPVLQNQFGGNAGVTNAGGVAQMRDTVEGLLGRYYTYLSLPISVFNAAKHVANIAQQKADIDGRNYASIAGGVLYATCILTGQRLDLKELSKHAHVTDSTIKLVAKRIASKFDLIMRDDWRERYAKGFATLQQMGGANQSVTVPGTPISVGSSASPSPKEGNTPLPEVDAQAIVA